MSGDTARSRKLRIIIADYQSVHRDLHLAVLDAVRPFGHRLRQLLCVGPFPVHRREAELIQPVHTCTPGGDFFICMDQGEGIEGHIPLPDFVQPFRIQCQRAGGQIARIGKTLRRVGDGRIQFLKLRIRDGRLTAYHQMSAILNLQREALDRLLHEGDVRSDAAVSAGEDLRESSAVIGQYQCQSVQLPAQPDRSLPRPFLQFFHLFGLRQGKSGKLMCFLLSGNVVLRRGVDLLGRAVRQDYSRFRLQPGQLIKERVPFEVGHDLIPAAVVGFGRLIQPPDHLLHSLSFEFCHNRCSRFSVL